jgi:hypothetical protein
MNTRTCFKCSKTYNSGHSGNPYTLNGFIYADSCIFCNADVCPDCSHSFWEFEKEYKVCNDCLKKHIKIKKELQHNKKNLESTCSICKKTLPGTEYPFMSGRIIKSTLPCYSCNKEVCPDCRTLSYTKNNISVYLCFACSNNNSNIKSNNNSLWKFSSNGGCLIIDGKKYDDQNDFYIYGLDNDDLIYFKKTGKYYLARDYNNPGASNKTEGFAGAKIIPSANKTLWRRGFKSAFVFVEGIQMTLKKGSFSLRAGEDHLVYWEQTKNYYLCRDYYFKQPRKSGSLECTEIINTDNSIIWRRDPDEFLLYDKGVRILPEKGIIVKRTDNDHIVIDKINCKTYICSNYYLEKKARGNPFHSAKIILKIK